MKVYVVCCNDSVEAVVLDDEAFAKIKIEELSKIHYERNKHSFRHDVKDYSDYRDTVYWHLHEVEVLT